jgi:hypothetical protein
MLKYLIAEPHLSNPYITSNVVSFLLGSFLGDEIEWKDILFNCNFLQALVTS